MTPLADEFKQAATMLRQQQEKLNKYELRHEEQRKRIDELEAYQKHDVELAEAIGWDKGYEAGRQLGMKQERALWELAASTQEIMDTHPVKEQSTNERIEMLKEMVEKSANPVGWVGYQEGHLVSFLKTQEQVNSFLTATDPTGKVEPVYTHPVKELTREDRLKLIGTLKWAEDLLREAGHDGAVSDAQDCLMILRKAQENG